MILRQSVEYLNMFIESFSFFFVIFRPDFHERTRKRTIWIAGCLAIWLIDLLGGFEWNQKVFGPFPIYLIWVYFLFYLLFQVKIVEMILLGIGQWLFISLMEFSIYIFWDRFITEEYIHNNVTTLTVTCCLWIFYFAIGKKMDSRIFRLPLKIWCLLDVIMFILTMMMAFFEYAMLQAGPSDRVMKTGRLLCALGEILIFILIFAMIYYYNSTHDYRMQKELAEIQNEQQREYFLQLLGKEEETKRFRHDIMNDLVAMQSFCEEKKYSQLEEYLNSTLGIVRSISKSNYDVGNDIVNTVLNYYLHPLKENYDIEVGGYMGADISIAQRDLCVLTANLIKNASEAVAKMKVGKIGVQIDQGIQYLSIKVKNSFDGQLVLDKKGNPKTSKPDKRNHGIGIHNIKQIAKKYHGTYHSEAKEGVYEVEVCLKI